MAKNVCINGCKQWCGYISVEIMEDEYNEKWMKFDYLNYVPSNFYTNH